MGSNFGVDTRRNTEFRHQRRKFLKWQVLSGSKDPRVNKPASLQWGELGYVTGIGSYGGLNQYKDRVFLGDDGTNANPVGGFYYTSMMEHGTGVIPAASHNSRNQDRGVVAIMAPATNSGLGGAESLKVNQWNVDNLRIDGNVISSTDTDGDIRLDPHGIQVKL